MSDDAKKKVEEVEKQVEEAFEETKNAGSAEESEHAESAPEVQQQTEGKKDAEPEEETEEPAEKEEKAPPVERETDWIPKTKLGNDILAGKYKSIDEVLEKGELILEPEIVDAMIPDLMQEVIYIGGSPGKGGGIRRTATKMTARMHKSGRRFKLSALVVVGNGNGVVGIGRGISKEHRTALEKATKNAKLSVIRVRRGCGSWECGCGGNHSIPFRVTGREGSVIVTLLPAPKGVGIVASEEVRKILKLAGLKDVWVKTSGKTETRTNLAMAVFSALKNLNSGKGDL